MSISAMPVIAKILVDLDLTKRNIGLVILSAGVVDDTVGWLILSLIAGAATHGAVHAADLGLTILWLAVFIVVAAFVLLPILRVAVRVTSRALQVRRLGPGPDHRGDVPLRGGDRADRRARGVRGLRGGRGAPPGAAAAQRDRRPPRVVHLQRTGPDLLRDRRAARQPLGAGRRTDADAGHHRGLPRQAHRLRARRLLGRPALLGGGLDRRRHERPRRHGDRGGDDWPRAGDPDAADVLHHRHDGDRDLSPGADRTAARPCRASG